jgi:hypothetical protein
MTNCIEFTKLHISLLLFGIDDDDDDDDDYYYYYYYIGHYLM